MNRELTGNLQNGVFLLIIFLLISWPLKAVAAKISDIDKYAWNENSGWINFNPTSGEVRVYATYLTGFVWSENSGWIKLGSDSSGPYANTTADNWGVNKDSSGRLSGYAWSENSGWINFNPAAGGVTIDPATREFSGYAWSENLGWISFGNPPLYGVKAINEPPVNESLPLIDGIAKVGNTLTGTTGTWTDNDGDALTYLYHWYQADDSGGSNETAIAGTSAGYFLTSSSAHKFLRVEVTADDGNGGIAGPVSSARVMIDNTAPVFTGSSAISGSPAVGNTLTLSNVAVTDPDGDPVIITYQWQADGRDISGANSAAYSLTSSEAHKTITCIVAGYDGYGGVAGPETASGVYVANSAPTFSATPLIVGIPVIGGTLGLSGIDTADPDEDPVDLDFQWQANGLDIVGATSSTCSLTLAEAHAAITCVISASDGWGGMAGPVTTAEVTVGNSAPVFTGTPEISGLAKAGHTLRLVDTGTHDADGDPVALRYQWHADDQDIPHADGPVYTIGKDNAGQTITCTIQANDAHGGATSFTTGGADVQRLFPWMYVLPGLTAPR